jgi:hypothetical protein
MHGDHGRLSLLGRRLGPGFRRRLIAIAPGHSRVYDQAEWRDAIVVVEHGEIDLECTEPECPAGGRHRFTHGDVLWLDGLPLRALRNSGREPAVLAAVSHRGGRDESRADLPSQE